MKIRKRTQLCAWDHSSVFISFFFFVLECKQNLLPMLRKKKCCRTIYLLICKQYYMWHIHMHMYFKTYSTNLHIQWRYNCGIHRYSSSYYKPLKMRTLCFIKKKTMFNKSLRHVILWHTWCGTVLCKIFI